MNGLFKKDARHFVLIVGRADCWAIDTERLSHGESL